MNAENLKKRMLVLLPGLLLLLFYITDGMTKMADRLLNFDLKIAKYTKITVLAFIVISSLRFWRKSVWLTIVAGIYILGQITIPDGFTNQINITFVKYIFPIIVFFFFKKDKTNQNSALISLRILETVLVINSLLIFIGFIFDFYGFHSYKYGERFGFNGLFLNSATSTYAYIIGLFCLLYRYQKQFALKPSIYIIITGAIFLGTKGALIGLLSVTAAYFMFFSKLSAKQKKWTIVGFLLIITTLFYVFFFRIGIFNEIRKEDGLITSILSLRNELLTERMLPFIKNKWSWENYLFGGYNDVDSRSQMGFLDVFYFWGIIGGLLYLFMYMKTFIISNQSYFYKWALMTLTFIVFLAGNFFENPSIVAFLLIFIKTFQHPDTETRIDEL